MILNHKEAIQYVMDNHDAIAISRTDLLNIHTLLADPAPSDGSPGPCLHLLVCADLS